MTDRLSLANALAEAKIDRPAAERIATEIFEAIHDSVATKSDLQHTEDATKAELKRIEDAMRAELQATRAELKADNIALRNELKADIAELRAEIILVEHRLLTRLGGLVVVVAGILFAVLRYLPPAH